MTGSFKIFSKLKADNIRGWICKYWGGDIELITPYIRMLDSDWLIAVIFFLQIQALHCEFAEYLLHVGVFA
jgi:hypothetical protein